jgi:transposase
MFNPGERRLWKDVDYPERRVIKLTRLVVTCAPPKIGKDKDPWFLGSSLPWSADQLIDLYAKRMLIEEDFRTAKSDLNWKHSRIRKLSHYRRFILFMVTCLVFSMILGLSAQRKPALIAQIIRTRKGKWDSCITRIGLLLLQKDMAHINYLELMRRLPV